MNYHRADALRILRISNRQFAHWRKAGLVATGELCSFSDLVQLKKIRDLRSKVKPAAIRASLEAMQKRVAGMENPLLEAGTFSANSRVVFRHQGRALEPTTGQLVMDFAPPQRVVPAQVHPMHMADSAGEFFARGVSLEDDPHSQPEAISCYQQVLALQPNHAAAHINLGTIFYNQREFAAAESHYRAAVEADPRYALAHFDLANVLDETGRTRAAVECYKTALMLAPTYADAHYNLALAYEKLSEPRQALRHWRCYLKLDRSGPWAVYAASQAQKILAADRLKLVYRK